MLLGTTQLLHWDGNSQEVTLTPGARWCQGAAKPVLGAERGLTSPCSASGIGAPCKGRRVQTDPPKPSQHRNITL